MGPIPKVLSLVLLVGCLDLAIAMAGEPACDGPYKGRTLTPEELATVLRDHQAWLKSGSMRQDERKANLCHADLREVLLLGARLDRANLWGARLDRADLQGADLSWADLHWARLDRANLQEAALYGANLQGAHLGGATLQGARLYEANLQGADLRGATLQGASLYRADLQGASLQGANLQGADLGGATLQKARLDWASLYRVDLHGARLDWATLQGARLSEANLQGATLNEADLQGARLDWADLQGARLVRADLQGATLVRANLQQAELAGATLQGAVYQPELGKLPNFLTLTMRENKLEALVFYDSPAGLIELREAFKKSGMRTQERQLTYAIEHTKQLHAWNPSWWHKDRKEDTRPWLDKLAGKSESLFSYVLFELPSGYGTVPSRALWSLLGFMPCFALFYWIALQRVQGHSGLWMIVPADRIAPGRGKEKLVRIRRHPAKTWRERLRGQSRLCCTSLYFSVLSAFHLGWRELNVGTWIARMQPREYTLRATGWVRTVSGFQSLLSVYLLALWVLTYFGRPFE
jgi:uncharacterized protein YjbI with pentapeptide repeats